MYVRGGERQASSSCSRTLGAREPTESLAQDISVLGPFVVGGEARGVRGLCDFALEDLLEGVDALAGAGLDVTHQMHFFFFFLGCVERALYTFWDISGEEVGGDGWRSLSSSSLAVWSVEVVRSETATFFFLGRPRHEPPLAEPG